MHLDHYRLLGRSGLRVSPLCLGTMTFGSDWGWGADESTSCAMFDRYAEAGGNFVDTADFYTDGSSERILGTCIGRDRDRFVIATKYTLATRRGDPNAGGNHRKNLVQSVRASLRRLDTDRIDLLWLHAWDGTVPADEVMRALDDLVRSGSVLHVGVSDTPAWKVAECNTIASLRGWSPFVALQVDYSLVRRDAERDLLPMARDLGLGVTPWSPLGGGVLTGKYDRAALAAQERGEGLDGDPFDRDRRIVRLTERKIAAAEATIAVAQRLGTTPARVAIRWLLERSGVTSPIVGARSVAQLEDDLGALELDLDDDARAALDAATAIELGFPHDFLGSAGVRDIIRGGTTIETPGGAR